MPSRQNIGQRRAGRFMVFHQQDVDAGSDGGGFFSTEIGIAFNRFLVQRSQRKFDDKRRAAVASAAAGLDGAGVKLHQFFGDGQTEAETAKTMDALEMIALGK